MKNRILNTSCLLILAFTAMGQTIMPLSTITYISEVPFVVKTGIHRNRLSDSSRLITLSETIQIALAPRNRVISSDRYFHFSKPLPIEDYEKIEYSCTHKKQLNPQWLPVKAVEKEQTGFPFGRLLADLSLQYEDSAILRFRYKESGQIFHQSVFHRPEMLPSIEAYRQKEVADSIDNKIKSLTANDPKKQWFGFDSLATASLLLSPGKKLDLLIRKNDLNRDSSILYRFFQTTSTHKPEWQLTGHLLSLHSLKSNSQYILEIRYRDMQLTNTYQLQILPRWHESLPGRFSVLLICITLFAAVFYPVYRYRLQRELTKRKQLEEQLATVQTQLNPHFVFNALSSIEGLVANQENDRANEYLTSFSDIMRDTLKNSRELMISLAQELDTLEKYLRVEQLRFEFKWMMEINPELDLDRIEFPPMLLQPVVENAIKHGASGLGKDGRIMINCRKEQNNLVIAVTNNGRTGIGTASKGPGYGLALTKERIERLNQLYKTENIRFAIDASSAKTSVTYFFENWIQEYENTYH